MKRKLSIAYMILLFIGLIYIFIYETVPNNGIGLMNLSAYVLIFVLIINYIISYFRGRGLIPIKILIVILTMFIVFMIVGIVEENFSIDALIGTIVLLPIIFIVLKEQILIEKNK